MHLILGFHSEYLPKSERNLGNAGNGTEKRGLNTQEGEEGWPLFALLGCSFTLVQIRAIFATGRRAYLKKKKKKSDARDFNVKVKLKLIMQFKSH